MSDHQDIIVIGAGVIGLSIAKHLSEAGREVLVLEKEKHFGMITSSRNSEVIHAGLYFAPDWLKTKLCVRGKELLYEYAAQRHIPHQRCGKILVAMSDAEQERLDDIKSKAELNGVHDLTPLSKADIKNIEPDISGEAGLFSPSSGIIDSHMHMVNMIGDIEDNSGMIAYNVEIAAIEKLNHGFKIIMADGYTLTCNLLINAAGLGAQKLATKIDAMSSELIPPRVMAKGHYFSYTGKTNFKHLVYPVPGKGSLGLHLCIDTGGGVKFGPDINFVEEEEYSVPETLKEKFVSVVSEYFPNIDPDKLHPDYAGIRPKLSESGLDFDIGFQDKHGIEGLVNLFGMESPGLTSNLAIGEYVRDKINEFG
ncbi:NAD(P)/FAD-dependent oxidoreductase [Pseudemcibacter aquimaris]|uniref:NAD(P)/FAD-dependent oxidoreductase n=1 Tax=Pseudemcibacter aquimaris TaxID=2857064 RepID=UPI002012B7E3|nr:NAD(P)/FAD-dependent oxidoreductase [Pseudemcibacter aquimaris]MCC3861075.1 NAD(P)/FAD-dependent oxidoreductase [Pseudemcibacter aquimaris]WDU59893.1 NAD(P)/FAD-dependent oxidoreductase [Pseudemcibacter aquimaris]